MRAAIDARLPGVLSSLRENPLPPVPATHDLLLLR
jgi:hypothetical protein